MSESPWKKNLKRYLDKSPLDVIRALRRHLGPPPPPVVAEKTRMSTDALAQLQLMREDNAKAGPPFTASKHWQVVTNVFEGVYFREGIKNPEEQLLNQYFSGFVPGDVRLHRYVCWLYRCHLARRDSLGLLKKLRATCRIDRGFAYEFEDEVLSLDLLFSIDDFYNIYELNPEVATDPLIVAELGAGWGRLGYVLREVNPKLTYIVYDLPEVLVVSQSYLPALLKAARFGDYSTARQEPRFSRQKLLERPLWFMGAQHMKKVDPQAVDVFVNIASFQEMPVSYITMYFQMISSIAGGGSCYFRQLRDGKSHGHRFDEVAGLDHYPFPAEWQRKYLRPSILSDEFFETGFSLPPAL